MTDQDQRFQHRWQFRRTEIDVDSSSEDDHSRPSSASEPKVVKQKLVPFSKPEDNANQTVHSPTSCAKEEKENISSIKEPNSKQKQPGKTHERKAKTRTKKATSNTEPTNGGALSDLKGHMVSLVEDIKNARMDLLKWMDNELKSSSSKVNTVSTKPSGTKKGQRQNKTRGKTQRSNPNNRRKKSGKVTQNGEGEASGKKSSPINEEVVVPSKETENVVITTIPVENTEKQKGKRPRLSAKKQKTAVVEADQQSNTTVAAAADNYLTLPSVLPQKQAENNERNPLNDGNEIDGEKRNTLNSGGSSSSYQVNFDPRGQQKDVVFAQNSMPRNVSNYEQNTGNTMGNGGGNGNGFHFPLVPQGSNSGIGMPNSIPSQFALQYLTQGNRISGMYRDHPGFPSGNHAFMGSYGGLNQQMTYNFQQGEVMALQCPDIRRAAFNQGNIANQ